MSSSVLLMEFTAKPWLQWDWENLDMFNAVAADDPKETTASVGFDFGLAPLSRSLNSTSISSFSTGDAKMPNPSLTGSEANQEGINPAIASKLEASAGSGEPLLTLKLGKRAYFDRAGTESSTKSSYISGIRESSATSTKRSKSSSQSIQAPCCQVEGCNLDLSLAKAYHRKHKVCENHSKCPRVVVDGLERRFCQQCSRFHGLTEFDEKKRSCRRRLSDHNARRRKPQPSSMQFNASELLSSYNDKKQEIHFAWNDIPPTQARHEMTNDSLPKLAKEGGDMWLHLPAGHLKSSFSMHGHDTNGFFSSVKGTISEILNPDREGSIITSNVDASPDLYHALSLLSKDSRDLSQSRSTSLEQCGLPQGSLLDSTCWRPRHQSTEAQPQNYASATLSGQYFEECPSARNPYESDFHSAWLN